MEQPRLDVFLAYTPRSREAVKLIAAELESRGLSLWLGAIDHDFKTAWKDTVSQALRRLAEMAHCCFANLTQGMVRVRGLAST
jgi:hypothetical protein